MFEHRASLKSLFTLWTSIKQGAEIGAHSAGEIPVTIPNTEVKPSSADYTALRETRKVPNYKKSLLKGVIFFVEKGFLWYNINTEIGREAGFCTFIFWRC